MGKVVRFRKEDWNSEEVFYNTISEQISEDSESDEPEAEIDPNPVHTTQPLNSMNESGNELQGGYIFEVWCTKPEYDLV